MALSFPSLCSDPGLRESDGSARECLSGRVDTRSCGISVKVPELNEELDHLQECRL